MIHLFWLGFALAATPGPDFFLLTSHTLSQGRKVGYMTLLGNRLSLLTHMTAALCGLAFLLQKFSILYHLIQSIGAVYLIYLGIMKLKKIGKTPTNEVREHKVVSMRQAFVRGYLNNLLNPKVSLFFLSLFPQFATPDQLSRTPLLIGLMMFLGNCTWYVPIVYLVGFDRIRASLKRCQLWLDNAFGFIFLGYGLRLIWGELRSQWL